MSFQGEGVPWVHIQDSGVTLACPDLCDLFARNAQPPGPRTTPWGTSSAWARRAWSWRCSGCCCSRLETARGGPTTQPGRDHRGDHTLFAGGSLGNESHVAGRFWKSTWDMGCVTCLQVTAGAGTTSGPFSP